MKARQQNIRTRKKGAVKSNAFTKRFEKRFLSTIKKYKLLSKKDRIAVACSGGKDSTVALYLVSKYFPDVTAITIDEGIPGYRNQTIDYVHSFCSEHKIKLMEYSFKREFGMEVGEIIKKTGGSACTTCGILRRWLINRKLFSYDKVVTGHNLDDEAEAVMMNTFKANRAGNTKLGPRSGVRTDSRFVPRVKPLYLSPEKEVIRYAHENGIKVFKKSCPYRKDAFRLSVRNALDKLEKGISNIRLLIVNNHLNKLVSERKNCSQEKNLTHCRICGDPSSSERCRACIILNSIKD